MFRNMSTTRSPNLDLKRERFRQQMAQTTLARRTRLSRKTLWAIEAGKVCPNFDTAARIAKALNVDMESIFTEEGVRG